MKKHRDRISTETLEKLRAKLNSLPPKPKPARPRANVNPDLSKPAETTPRRKTPTAPAPGS